MRAAGAILLSLSAAHALWSRPLLRRPRLSEPRWVCGRPRRSELGPPGGRPRRRLTGLFVEPRIDEFGNDRALDPDRFIALPDGPQTTYDDERPRFRNTGPWSSRQATTKANWAKPAFREAVLAKRNATRTANRLARTGGVAPPPPPPRTPAQLRKAEALSLLAKDEVSWMQSRLADGEAQRRLIFDDESKQRRQAERSARAKLRHQEMRAAAAAEAAEARAARARRKRGPGRPARGIGRPPGGVFGDDG